MEKKTYADMRSNWEFGEASECRKGLMCGMGYTVEEQRRPLIGVVNSWNEYNPGHVHLDKLAERVKQGIREAGGLPVEVMTTAVCDGMVMKDPRYIEVPSRNLIADQVELTSESNMFDGMVLLSTCDSIVPGHLMGAARVNIPTILVTGGYMPLGHCRGQEVLHIHTLGTGVALKCHHDTAHRYVMPDQIIQQCGDQKNIQPVVTLDALYKLGALCLGFTQTQSGLFAWHCCLILHGHISLMYTNVSLLIILYYADTRNC